MNNRGNGSFDKHTNKTYFVLQKRCKINRKEEDSNHLPVQGEDTKDGGSTIKNTSSTVAKE